MVTQMVLVFAIVAIGLLGIAVLEVTLMSQEQQQQVDAKGCQSNSVAFNGSQGRCFKG